MNVVGGLVGGCMLTATEGRRHKLICDEKRSIFLERYP